ncbi:SH3 domain-containing protein [Paraburkholderia nemoris]|uniref:SH3 domain-containing protein n=1 Tax=Paraburkholderia nemoris TaxID=2793076 RepID=UPI0038BDA5BA
MQKKIVIRAIAGGVCLMALSSAAFAQSPAYTNQPVYVYAGPSGEYPVVAQVPPSAQLTVYGCVSDYSWCDVEAPGLRGWVYGEYLDYPYQGTEVPIMTYGLQIGLPVVAFSFGPYWDHYYRGQPWYHDRDRWVNHPPPHGGPPAAGAPAMNPRPVMHGGPQPQQQPQPGYAHGPTQPQPQPQPGYPHGPAQPPGQMAGGHQGQAAVHPGGPSGEHGGEARGGNEDRNHPQDNH